MIRLVLRKALLTASVLLLAACGGGGGGGRSQPGPPQIQSVLSVASNTMTFNARLPGSAVPTQMISASVSNASQLTGTLYVLVTSAGTPVQSISGVNVVGNTGTATVTPAESLAIGAGTHTGTITVRACMNSANCSTGELAGSPQVVSVTYTVGALVRRHALVASQTGVGLAALPSRSVLTRTVAVSDSLGHAVPWSAVSNQTWLSVTSTGVTPGDLVVTASPVGLAADQTHFATVTVTSGENGVAQSETIRVGFWVGSQDPVSPQVITGNFTETITDPIRPLAYSHGGETTLSVHNVFTGQLVATIPFAKRLGQMTVAHDGSRLFVGDNDFLGTTGITPVDLETRTVAAAWAPSTTGGSLSHLEFVRVDGASLIVTGQNVLVNANTGTRVTAEGAVFADPGFNYSNAIIASRDGSLICSMNSSNSGGFFFCYNLLYTEEGGAVAVLRPTTNGATGNATRDAAMRPDGSRLYATYINVSSFSLPVLSRSDLITILTPNNVELLPDGRVLAGMSRTDDGADVRMFDANNVALGDFRLGTTEPGWKLLADQVKVSSDGLRIVSLAEMFSTVQRIQFTNTP